MKKILYITLKGCGHLPNYGYHPGTIPLLAFIGISGLFCGWKGAAVATGIVLPLFLIGAYSRAKGEA